MTEYVAGFMLTEDGLYVNLIEKARPDWQAGFLNGVGGHIEPGETPAEAMRREFIEEAGVDCDLWQHFATVAGEWGRVWFFRAAVPRPVFDAVQTMSDEGVVKGWNVDYLLGADGRHLLLPNLRWLLPLGRYTHDLYEPVVAREASPTTDQRIEPRPARAWDEGFEAGRTAEFIEHGPCCGSCPTSAGCGLDKPVPTNPYTHGADYGERIEARQLTGEHVGREVVLPDGTRGEVVSVRSPASLKVEGSVPFRHLEADDVVTLIGGEE